MRSAVVMAREATRRDIGMGTYVVISRRGRQETEDQPEGTQDAGAGGGVNMQLGGVTGSNAANGVGGREDKSVRTVRGPEIPGGRGGR